jgi:FO synthase subunit 2
LSELREAGLGSLPGTSAEILDPEVRDVISPGRITVEQWVDVITTAHRLGVRTTSTMMFGHLETPMHWVKHMNLLRDIQHDTRGFTEFVPLSMIYQDAPMYRHHLASRLRPGPTGVEVMKVHAVARIMLGSSFRNIQSSWVKEGPKLAQYLLTCGANDLGGTLMNESISTSAGSQFGQMMTPAELERLIRDIGRTPAQRRTDYQLAPRGDHILDHVVDAEQRFGTYSKLAASKEFRFADSVQAKNIQQNTAPARVIENPQAKS